MNNIDLDSVKQYVNENIVDFHKRRIRSLEELKLKKFQGMEWAFLLPEAEARGRLCRRLIPLYKVDMEWVSLNNYQTMLNLENVSY